MSVVEQIAAIEAEMLRTQKNKATNAHLGKLKAKIAKLKRDLLAPSKGSGGGEAGFEVRKYGDCRVGMVGFPSVGKSTLLTALTDTESEVAAYEFTTLTTIPGVLKYNGCNIQLLDMPGIIEGAKDGRGRGKQVIAVARTCELILIVLDAGKPLTHKRILEKELEGFGIRLNQRPPDATLSKRSKGGISLQAVGCELTHIDLETVTSVLKESRIVSAELICREDITVDQLIDIVEGNRVYIPCLYVLNKIDDITIEELELLSQVPHYVPVSARHEWNFDALLEKIWSYLDMIRVYTKPRGQQVDFDDPMVLPRNRRSVEEFCRRIHKSIMGSFKHALVWGQSVKHQPQRVGKDHLLEDEDVIQIVKKV